MKTGFIFGTKDRLLLWDGAEFRAVHRGWGPYVGVTWDEERVYAVARGHPQGEAILAFDPDLVYVDKLPIPDLKGTNYIGWFGGRLYVTNTGRDRLEVWDGKKVSTWHYTGCDEDVNHINSVWSDGERIYVTEGGRSGNRARVFSKRRKLLRTEEDLGRSIHCVYREGDWLYTVSSMGEAVAMRNLETGERREASYVPHHRGYGEGLCRLEGRWFVGVSQDSPNRSAVLAFDDGWQFMEKLLLPPDIGQLYEVRATTGVDRAHNGLEFPGRVQ